MMKTENEKLREVLRCIADLPMDRCSTENDYRLSAAKAIALGALSQQVEPAPAQDEREAVARDAELFGVGFMIDGVRVSPDRVTVQYAIRPAQTEQQPAGVVLPPQCTDKSEHVKYRKGWNSCLSEVFRLNRAQTEQQPVGHQFQDRQGVWKQFMSERHYEDTLADGTWPIRAIYAAPIAQTAPQSGKVIAYRTLDRHGNLVTDWIDGDPEGGEPIVPGGSFQLAYAAPIAQTVPAQDGREAPKVVAVLYKSGGALTAEECGIALDVCAKVETPLMTVAQHERIVARLSRPAQTEQRPVYQKPNWENNYGYNKHVDMRCRDEANALVAHLEGLLDEVPEGPLYAAPIAQTAPQPEQSELVEALEQYADDLNWCYDTCNIGRDIAKDALAAYHATLSAQGASK